jgi:Protein of unknown function (DUF1761)
MQHVHFGAVTLAAAGSFLLGGIWYSPLLFGKIWLRESKTSPQPGHPARVFGVSFLFAFVAAVAFAWWLGPEPTWDRGLLGGAVAGAGLVAASFGINYQFSQKSFLLWLIDGGYHIVQFLLYGLVFGLWSA